MKKPGSYRIAPGLIVPLLIFVHTGMLCAQSRSNYRIRIVVLEGGGGPEGMVS
jgi:hypothetical protein